MSRTPRQYLRLALLRTFAHLTHSPTLTSPTPNRANRKSSLPLRILVIRPDHLGDLLFTTPALRALRQRYPAAHITALIGPWGAPVLSNNPHVDAMISLPFPGFSRQPKTSLWQPYGLLRDWAPKLRGKHDLAIILRFDHWWGGLLTYLARIPYRIGYGQAEVAPFLSHAIPYIAGRHEVAQNLRLIDWDLDEQRWAARYQSRSPSVYPLEYVASERSAAWVSDSRPIAIHPGAGAAVKLWRAERWATVADALSTETGAQILLTGSIAEQALCREIAEKMHTEARVLAGETTLDQLASVLAGCRLVLGPDSGPLHLAVALGAPTIHLFGPVSPMAFGPWGPTERHRVLLSDWPCIPCNRLDYGPDELAHHPCVRDIGVNPVLATAREVLSS